MWRHLKWLILTRTMDWNRAVHSRGWHHSLRDRVRRQLWASQRGLLLVSQEDAGGGWLRRMGILHTNLPTRPSSGMITDYIVHFSIFVLEPNKAQMGKAELFYHDQFDVLITRRPILWPNLLMTWLNTRSIKNMPLGQIWQQLFKPWILTI